MLRLVSVSLMVLALVACGGGSSSGSGVSSSKKLTELSSSERDALCGYVVSAEGSVRTQVCDGFTITTLSATTCTTGLTTVSASCTATVDNAETCAEAASDDLCKVLSSSDCLLFLSCVGTAGRTSAVSSTAAALERP
jgi:hypothetical protein